MKKGWEIKKLGEVCSIIGGGTPSKKNSKFYDGEIHWATVRDMKQEVIQNTEFKITKEAVKRSSTNIIPRRNVIISTRVGLGKVCLTEIDTAINQDLRGIIPNNEKLLDVPFLFYWFKSISHLIIAEGKGATVQGITLPFIKNIQIPLPPLPEQQRIVSILDEAFAAIDKAKANAEQNLKNARELFESYLQGVFEKKGEGWEEKKLGEISKIKPPKSEVKERLTENDMVSFLPMEDLGVVQNEVNAFKERKLLDVFGNYTYFADDDVLLAKITPCFENGKLGVVKNLRNGIGFGSSEYIVFRCSENVIPSYLFYFLSRISFKSEGRRYMSGAVGHKRVSKDWIENYLIPFPKTKLEQQSIVRQLDALQAESKKLESGYQQKIASLDELKKSILKKAFAGELPIGNITEHVEPVRQRTD